MQAYATQPQRAWTTGTIIDAKAQVPQYEKELDNVVLTGQKVVMKVAEEIQAKASTGGSTSGPDWKSKVTGTFAGVRKDLNEGLDEAEKKAIATIEAYPPSEQQQASDYLVQAMEKVRLAAQWVLDAINKIWTWVKENIGAIWQNIKSLATHLLSQITQLFW